MDSALTDDEIIERLKAANLRPTRQRIALASLLFGCGDRHVTAEVLHADAVSQALPVSLATVYNTLHQFTEAGLLREVAIEGSRTYFDTNTSNHSHFYFESDGELVDIAKESVPIVTAPEPPAGMTISRIDVLVRLVKSCQ
jgi:Fur family transcriptional regulator, iron response regulator